MPAMAAELPARHFKLIEAGSHQVAARLTAEPNADLELLGNTPGWTHFDYSILAPAVLDSKHHPASYN